MIVAPLFVLLKVETELNWAVHRDGVFEHSGCGGAKPGLLVEHRVAEASGENATP
jgi:hypothetical protein